MVLDRCGEHTSVGVYDVDVDLELEHHGVCNGSLHGEPTTTTNHAPLSSDFSGADGDALIDVYSGSGSISISGGSGSEAEWGGGDFAAAYFDNASGAESAETVTTGAPQPQHGSGLHGPSPPPPSSSPPTFRRPLRLAGLHPIWPAKQRRTPPLTDVYGKFEK